MKTGIKQFFWKIADFLSVPYEERKLLNIIAGQDGRLYEVYQHPIGRLVTPVQKLNELDPICPGFQLSLPKIPGTLLEMSITFFRAYCFEEQQYEVMVEFYWDKADKRYSIHVPKQLVSKTSIYAESEIRYDERYIQVLQLHSHNTMKAYFSSIDNQDEVAFGLYGVVGELNKVKPDVLLRVGRSGRYVYLPVEYVFEKADLTRKVPFPSEWHESIVIQS